MAILWAHQIMIGKRTFDQVPRLLKDAVRVVLADSGVEHLARE